MLRAWAIVWIVAYHLMGNTRGYLTLNEAAALLTQGGIKSTVDSGLALFVSAGSTGVSVFLIISGFGLTASWWKKYGSLGREGMPLSEFWQKRVFRIFPLFWAAVAIATLLYFLNPDWAPFGQDIWQQGPQASLLALLTTLTTLRNFIFDHYYFLNGAWWYVGLSLQLYLVFPWLIRWGCRWGWSKLLLASLLFSLAYRAVCLLSLGESFGTLIPLAFFPSRLFEFVFGIYLAMTFLKSDSDSQPNERLLNERLLDEKLLDEKLPKWLKALLLEPQFIPLNFGVFFTGFICKSLDYPVLTIFAEALVGVGLFCGLVSLAQILRTGWFTRTVGKYSYGIYLIHMNVYLVLWPLALWVPSYWLRFVLVLLVTCGIGVGFDIGFAACRRAVLAASSQQKTT